MFEANIFINHNHYSLSSNQNKAAKTSTIKTMTANRIHKNQNNNYPDKNKTKKRELSTHHSSNGTMQLLSRLVTCNAQSSRHYQTKPLMTITILTTLATIILLFTNGFITKQVDGASVNSVGKYKSQRDRGK